MSVKSTLKEYKRVLTITKKPSKEELKTVIKVTGLGILALGFIGFIIFILMHYIKISLGIAQVA